jgi:hypothetical protein
MISMASNGTRSRIADLELLDLGLVDGMGMIAVDLATDLNVVLPSLCYGGHSSVVWLMGGSICCWRRRRRRRRRTDLVALDDTDDVLARGVDEGDVGVSGARRRDRQTD